MNFIKTLYDVDDETGINDSGIDLYEIIIEKENHKNASEIVAKQLPEYHCNHEFDCCGCRFYSVPGGVVGNIGNRFIAAHGWALNI